LAKVNKQTLAEKTADSILNMIYCDNYAIGSKLPGEYELASELEVGRNTLRAAIQILVSKNVLEVRKGSGTFVSKRLLIGDDPLGLSMAYNKKKMADDLIQLRFLIEPTMASLAAQNATAKERNELLRICEEMDELFRQKKSYLLKDLEFHALITSCSRNQAVSNIVPSIHQALLLQHNIPKELLGSKTLVMHRAIAEAINEGRGSDAYDYMQMHLIQNKERIKQK